MLKLKQLNLDGFLSYDKAVIPLDANGITFIQGETGAGKSSIFEAIFYLLYGKTLRKKPSINDLENKVLKDGFEISLIFELDKVEYTVKEIRNRKNNGLFLFEGSVDIREKTDPLTRSKLVKILKMSDEEFKNLVFLGQRQSQKFIDGTSGDRAGLISELFNLQKYEEFIYKADKVLKEKVIEKEMLSASIKDLQKNIRDLEKTLKEQDKVKPIDEALLKTLEDNFSELDTELRRVRYEHITTKETLAKIEVSNKNVEQLKFLLQQIEQLKEKAQRNSKIRYSLQELRKAFEKGTIKKENMLQKIAKKEKELCKILSAGNLCPISNKECTLKIPSQFKEEREKTIYSEIEKISTEFDMVSDKLIHIEELLNKKEQHEELKAIIDNKMKVFESLSSAIEEIKSEDKENILQKVAFFSKKIPILEQQIQKQSKRINELKTKKCLFDQQEEYKASILKLFNDRTDEIVKKQQNVEELSSIIQYFTAALTVFKQLKLYKIDLILDRINYNVQEQLAQISDCLKVNFSSIKAKSRGGFLDNLNISVTNGQIVLPIEMLSGGQTTQISLAILLGVYKTVCELSEKSVNLIFLDEAFGTLSDDLIDETFDSIVKLTRNLGFNNIKIISHRELDSRKFDHLWKINRINGLSSLSIVS